MLYQSSNSLWSETDRGAKPVGKQQFQHYVNFSSAEVAPYIHLYSLGMLNRCTYYRRLIRLKLP